MEKLRKRKLKKRCKGITVLEERGNYSGPIKIRFVRKKEKNKTNFLFKELVTKSAFLFLIAGLIWTASYVVIGTLAFFNDTESSAASFVAGALDFELGSPLNFNPSSITLGESATRDITFLNNANLPKYNISVTNFSGQLCEHLNLEARLDEGDILYSGSLISFVYGPLNFEEPDIWSFVLTLPVDVPESVQGENCQFSFIFFGSQIRNNLPFGKGFNDVEEITNNILAKFCYDVEIRTIGFWKNHEEVYSGYLPVSLGDESITISGQVDEIFDNADADEMVDMLKAQLLAMKFNIAHFGIEDYFVESEGKTLNQIVTEADDLLNQDPEPAREALEEMKTLLDYLNNLHEIRHCSDTPQQVNFVAFTFQSAFSLPQEIIPEPELPDPIIDTTTPSNELVLIQGVRLLEEPELQVEDQESDETSTSESEPGENELIVEEEPVVEEELPIEELPIEEESPVEEEEIIEDEPIVVEEEEPVIEEPVKEPTPEEVPIEESHPESEPEPEIEAVETEETPVDETPIVEEQPATVPDDTLSDEGGVGENDSDDGGDGDSEE